MIGLYSANSQAITSAPFSFGNALQFDGTDDYISRASFITSLNDTCTFGMWVKPLNTNTVYLNSCPTASAHQLLINAGSNLLRYRFNTGLELNITTTINQNVWNLIIYSKTTTDIRIFVNGVEVANQAYTSPNFSSGNMVIGSFRGTSNFANAIIDQFFIVSGTQITSTEASALYNGGNGDFVSNAIGTPDLLINFNQNSPDATATDESGNGYDFTLNNFNTSSCWVSH